MSKTLFVSIVMICASVVLAGPKPSAVNNQDVAKTANKKALKVLRATDEWAGMNEQLDQFTNHLAQLEVILVSWDSLRVEATNSIAATTGVNKTALTKLMNCMEKDNQAASKIKTMLSDLKSFSSNAKKVIVDSVQLSDQ